MMTFGLTPSDWFDLPYWERVFLAEWYATYQDRMHQEGQQDQVSPQEIQQMVNKIT